MLVSVIHRHIIWIVVEMESREVAKKSQNIDNIEGNTVEMKRKKRTHLQLKEHTKQRWNGLPFIASSHKKYAFFYWLSLFFFSFSLSSIDLFRSSRSIRFQCSKNCLFLVLYQRWQLIRSMTMIGARNKIFQSMFHILLRFSCCLERSPPTRNQ